MVKIRTNAREYQQTLRLYARARKKTHAEVINRFAQQANFKMLRSEGAGGVKRAKIGKFPLNATADPERGGKSRKNRFYFALLTSRGVVKGSGLLPAAVKEYRARRKAKGAMAAGFLVSARKLGLKRGGGAIKLTGGSASRSSGREARTTARKPVASSINAVKGSFEVGRKAMDRAISAVLRDARKFALKLIQRANDKARRGR